MTPELPEVPGLEERIPDLLASLDHDASPRRVMMVGEALFRVGRVDQAIDLLTPLIERDADAIAPRVLLSWSLEAAGREREAERCLHEVHRLDPANPFAVPSPPEADEPPEPEAPDSAVDFTVPQDPAPLLEDEADAEEAEAPAESTHDDPTDFAPSEEEGIEASGVGSPEEPVEIVGADPWPTSADTDIEEILATPAPEAPARVVEAPLEEPPQPMEPSESTVEPAEPSPAKSSDPWAAPEREAEPESLSEEELREVPPGPLYSVTLAEIFARQGFEEKAIEIYREILRHHPERSDLSSRVDELEARLGGDRLT